MAGEGNRIVVLRFVKVTTLEQRYVPSGSAWARKLDIESHKSARFRKLLSEACYAFLTDTLRRKSEGFGDEFSDLFLTYQVKLPVAALQRTLSIALPNRESRLIQRIAHSQCAGINNIHSCQLL